MTKTIYQKYFKYINPEKKYVHLETLDKKPYKIPRKVFVHLVEAKNRVEQNLDAPFVITGEVGAGKSNAEIVLGGTWENFFHKRKFSLNDLYWKAEDVSEQLDKYDNMRKFIGFDEAIQGSSTMDGIKKIGKIYNTKLNTKRFKKHLLASCIPQIKDLSDTSLKRVIAWYHVELTKNKRTGEYTKGILKVLSAYEAIIVADWLRKDKKNITSKHPIVKRKPEILLDNYMDGLWFSEEEYDKIKSEKTSEIEEEENQRENEVMMQRNKAINYCLELGAKQHEVAQETGLSRSLIGDIKKKMTTTN